MKEAFQLLSSRRLAYKVNSQNFHWRFLLFQALLDYSSVHNRNNPRCAHECDWIEQTVRQWIQEDG